MEKLKEGTEISKISVYILFSYYLHNVLNYFICAQNGYILLKSGQGMYVPSEMFN